MTSPNKCPTCGTVLPPDAPAGQCGHCLLQLGLFVEPEIESSATIVAIAEKPGDWIGSYKLIEVLGEGGCGKVYLADQEEPVRREVALKIIKLGMDTAQFIARFEAERQALALMNHPNIAKVFDAGATETGRPFFVMELVRGEPITDFCNQRQLSIKERLGLFHQVCLAIQHAHQKGIIHRDLKPSNVLVTENDEAALPKIIDFGIAKATGGQQLTDKTLFTAFEQFIGTPAYMSPEQAELGGADIDTRSDIYSLGVLLYELLTAKMPFEPKRLFDAGSDEIRRIIREEEPPKPSTKLTEQLVAADVSPLKLEGDVDNKISADSHRLLRGLVHQVRGDLDWIVMKALEKDRARRYETANDFALDLLRHLNNEPVVARPPSNVYRFQKMVRRNKLVFGAITAVAAALIAGLAFSTWMFFNEREARQRATVAEQEQTRLREIAETRAYSSDMNLAAQSAQSDGSLSGMANLLASWRNHTPDLRGWEWYYLNGLCHQDQLTVTGDTNGLLGLCWSPNGAHFAVAGQSGHITICDASDGSKLTTLNGTSPIYGLTWHPQTQQLAAASHDGNITLWNISNDIPIRTWQAHSKPARSVMWSSDGRQLISGGMDGTIGIWNPDTGAEILRLISTNYVQVMALNKAGTQLATAGGERLVNLWDISTGKHLRRIVFQTVKGGYVGALAWSPDGLLLATGGSDFVIRIWDVTTGEIKSEFEGHSGAIMALDWSQDGQQLVSIGRDDGAVKLWEASTSKLAQSFRGHLQGARSVAWHPDGLQVASASLDGTAKIWSTQLSNPSQTHLQGESVLSTRWSPDGNRLAIGDKKGQVQIWNRTNKTSVNISVGHVPWSWAVAWHPNGKQIASGGSEGIVKLWDAASGTELGRVSAFKHDVRTVAWNPQGTKLAAGGSDGQLKIWDSAGKNLLAAMELGFPVCFAMAWSPNGEQIAAVVGQNIKIFAVAAGQLRHLLKGHRDMARCLAWSADGKRLASGGDDVIARIWDSESGKLVQTLSGHSGSIYGVAWSPDDRRLITGSWDHAIKIWNPITSQELCSIVSHQREITSVSWSVDGHRIVSGDLGGKIVIHDSSPGY